MWYYVKKSLIIIVYLIFNAVCGFGILMIDNSSLLWLKIALSILNMALFCFLMAMMYYKEGQDAVKVRHANDLERREIVRTGENRPLKLKEEYKTWKGFMFGFIACIPLLVCLVIHTVLMIAAGTGYIGGGSVASFFYMVFYTFLYLLAGSPASPIWWLYYILVAFIPVIMCAVGVPYILGGMKTQRQYDRIARTNEQIYGKKK